MTDKIMRRALYRAKTDDEGITRFVASDSRIDRYGDIVRQSWDLSNFQNNPIVPQNHDYTAPIVGKVIDIAVENGRLMCSIKWDDNPDNPDGQRVARQMRVGFLNAVSVGFEPGAAVQRSTLDPDNPWYGKAGLIFGNESAPNRLLEVSAVSLPANEGALAQRINRHVLSVDEADGKLVVTYAADDAPDDDAAAEEPEVNIWDDDDEEEEDRGAELWSADARTASADPAVVRAMLEILRTNDFVRSEIGALAAEWIDDSTTTKPAGDWWGDKNEE